MGEESDLVHRRTFMGKESDLVHRRTFMGKESYLVHRRTFMGKESYLVHRRTFMGKESDLVHYGPSTAISRVLCIVEIHTEGFYSANVVIIQDCKSRSSDLLIE
jgi:hypothetical protein